MGEEINKKLFFAAVIFLAGIFLFFPGVETVSAYTPIPCAPPDQDKTCGYLGGWSTRGSCEMSGSDIDSIGNRVLGGEICSLGGSDNSGYYMLGTNEPNPSTQTYQYPGSTPLGWMYSKDTSGFENSIPVGEYQIDDYTYNRFFGGPVHVWLPLANDESWVNVGGHYYGWTGCTCNIINDASAGCPSLYNAAIPILTLSPATRLLSTQKTCAVRTAAIPHGAAVSLTLVVRLPRAIPPFT
jgi:hypothetical protein